MGTQWGLRGRGHGNSQGISSCSRENPCVGREALRSLLSVHPFPWAFLDHCSLILSSWPLEAQRWSVSGPDTQAKSSGHCASLEMQLRAAGGILVLSKGEPCGGRHLHPRLAPAPAAGRGPVWAWLWGGRSCGLEACLRITWLRLPWMGAPKLAQSSNRLFSVQGNMYHKGEAVGQIKRALGSEAGDTGSSPGPGSTCPGGPSASSPVTGRCIPAYL